MNSLKKAPLFLTFFFAVTMVLFGLLPFSNIEKVSANPGECSYQYVVFDPGDNRRGDGYSVNEPSIAIEATSDCQGVSSGDIYAHEKDTQFIFSNGAGQRIIWAGEAENGGDDPGSAANPVWRSGPAFESFRITVDQVSEFNNFFDTNPINPDNPEAPDLNPDQLVVDSEVCEDAGGTFEDGECISSAATADESSCASLGLLSWALCPAIRTVEFGLNSLDTAVRNALILPPEYFERDSPLRSVWASMRNIALVLLVPLMLVMVISTALGFEFVSAYTVKKALPRLFFAAILITLSWDLIVFSVIAINGLGQGMLGLITAPVGGFENTGLSDLITPAAGATSSLVLGVVVGGVIGIGGLAVLGSFALSAFLVLFLIFTVLVIREMLIVTLVVLAPLALLAWIFPANTRLWGLWYGTLSKMLLLFPLIMILFGSGRLVASLVEQTSPSLFRSAFIITAYVAPYFLIPSTFKFASGLLGNLAGMVNDKERGLFDRQKKFRQNRNAQNWQATKTGSRFNGDRAGAAGWAARRFNRAGAGVGAGAKGNFGFGAKGVIARANNGIAGADELSKENRAFAAQVNNEDTMAALALGGDYNTLRNLTHFKKLEEKDGKDAADKAARDAVNAAKVIGINGRTKSAASEALARSGKVIENRDEAKLVYATAAGGSLDSSGEFIGANPSLYNSIKGRDQYTSRQVGRLDIGRGSPKGAMEDYTMAEIGKMKPLAAVQFAKEAAEYIINDPTATDTQREHVAELLIAAEGNPYTNAVQQDAIRKAKDEVKEHPDGSIIMNKARANAQNRMYSRQGVDPEGNPQFNPQAQPIATPPQQGPPTPPQQGPPTPPSGN